MTKRGAGKPEEEPMKKPRAPKGIAFQTGTIVGCIVCHETAMGRCGGGRFRNDPTMTLLTPWSFDQDLALIMAFKKKHSRCVARKARPRGKRRGGVK